MMKQRRLQHRDVSGPIEATCRAFLADREIPAIYLHELTRPLIDQVNKLLDRHATEVLQHAAEQARAKHTGSDVELVAAAMAEVWNDSAGLPATTFVRDAAVAVLTALTVAGRLVPAEPRPAGTCRSRIAHESGAVLACTVDHNQPVSGLHANSHHRVLWDDDDDRVLLETTVGALKRQARLKLPKEGRR